MPFNIGCPNCGSSEHLACRVDGEWYDKLRIDDSRYNIGELKPYICLNCGNIYIDRDTLQIINKKVNDNG